MANIITTNWTANSTTPLYDADYPSGDRPFIYSDADYPPVPTVEPSAANQRFVGGAGANDSNDGTEGTPWATWDKAMQELCASSTWYCLNIGGDITVSSTFSTKFYGSGPGSSIQFAYIRPDPALGSRPTLTVNATVEVDGQDYWLWYGFDLAGTSGHWFGQDTSTSHHTIRNMVGVMTGTGGDNIGFFYGINSNIDYFGAFNNNFTGPGVAGVHGNTACLITFGSVNLRWENNIVTNCPRPLYYKHANVVTPTDVHIRKNYQYDTVAGSEPCFFSGDGSNSGVWEIVDNIFESNVEISNGGGGAQPDSLTIENNTFFRDLQLQGGGGGEGNDDVVNSTVRNNVINVDYELLRYTSNTNTNTSNYNLFGNNAIYQTTTYSSLATWQSATSQDANSVFGAPTFVGGATPSTIAGYALDVGSNGKDAGSDGNDMGANVTTVGNL